MKKMTKKEARELLKQIAAKIDYLEEEERRTYGDRHIVTALQCAINEYKNIRREYGI